MTNSKFSLEGKIAVVTGAAGARGIGRATALMLAEAGADVAVCDVNVSGRDFDLEGTAEAVRKIGRRSLTGRVDIADEAGVNDFLQKVAQEFGTLDIMVNNAAVGALTPSYEVNEDLWNKVLHTNMRGCHNCCTAAARIMKAKGRGSIINISSISGLRWLPSQYVYGVSKAGIIQITRWLGRELAASNVRVNSIAPGGVATDINSHDIGGFNRKPESSAGPAEKPKTALKFAQPEDIASVALFLASDASGFITGQTLIVDGGSSL
jgi:NAD(P)-dependent dehydrogenase (short-subunit alcohol dehydrogenase family)